jgi:hypothetical protein
MDPKTRELHSLLEQTIELLDSCEEEHWSQWLEKSKNRIENGDFSGVNYLLNAYGGMGSFNDLVIHRLNGYKISEDEVKAVNDRLNNLRGRMFELANQIKRDVQTG